MEIQKLKQTVYLPVEEGTSDMSVSYWEKDVHIADVKEIEAFVFTPEQLNEYTAKVIKDNMKGEYIIINKADIQKRIEEFQELWKAHSTYPNRTDLCINYAVKISLLKQIISQSTPLVTETEKAQNNICDILLKPMEQLKPLEDLWRKENSPDKFIAPDTTQFFIWIREKILNANK